MSRADIIHLVGFMVLWIGMLIGSIGCYKEGEQVSSKFAPHFPVPQFDRAEVFQVEYLFSVEGKHVYRFVDGSKVFHLVVGPDCAAIVSQ
jgi:hypothetical protein